SFGTDANLLLLEFSLALTGFVRLSSLKDSDISLHFELSKQRQLLLQILQSLHIDHVEFLDKSRSERQVTDIIDTLGCTRHRTKAPAASNYAPASHAEPLLQHSDNNRVTVELGEIEAHEKVENPTVSVCLPVRKAEKNIPAARKSILAQ